MHILIIPSWYPDERNINDVNGIFFKELAEAYAQQGNTVSVLAHFIPFPLHPKKIKNFLIRKSYQTINRVQTYNVKFLNWSGYRHIDDSSSIEAAVKWFGRYIRKNGCPQVIHAHSIFNAGLLALKIKEKYNVPYYLTEHGTWFLKEMPDDAMKVAKKVFRNAKQYTAVGSVLLNKLIESFNTDPNSGKIIYNTLPQRFLNLTVSTRASNKFVFLNIALDGHKKRRDLLIDAFACFFKDNLGVELCIGGTTVENEAIINQAKNLNIKKQIKLLGLLSREQVQQAMANCNAFVLSSDIETFGIVLIEALSQGKPIISTDSGGPKDIVNETNGILVPLNDVKALGEAMKKVKDNYNNYNAEIIREECLNKYHPNVIINQYLSLFQQ